MADDLAAIGVEEFLVSAAAGLASLGYARLEAKDLAEAKLAIDALQSLLPHIAGEIHDRPAAGAHGPPGRVRTAATVAAACDT